MALSHRKIPSSHARSLPRLTPYDVAVALLAPLIAIVLRNEDVLVEKGYAGLIYASLAFAATLIMLAYYRVGADLSKYFSPYDMTQLGKVAIASVALTVIVLFPITRLEGVPRAVPLLHVGTLFLGLSVGRALYRVRNSGTVFQAGRGGRNLQRVLVVGTDNLAWFYIRVLDSLPFVDQAVAGLLSRNDHAKGRTLSGHTILGSCAEAGEVLAELSVHGVEVTRLVVADPEMGPGTPEWLSLATLCSARNIELDFLPERLKLLSMVAADEPIGRAEAVRIPEGAYWSFKRVIDVTASLVLVVLLLPAMLIVALLVGLSFGFPLIFWQERLGQHARPIHVHKFRTYLSPFDAHGRHRTMAERETKVGRFLRASRLDELPQLFDILRGDMSFIGPRPLLPVDQPRDMHRRLSVRPGLTGWAQVNGGKIITPEEKGALDCWYIAHASFWLDLRVVLLTVRSVLFGDRQNHAVTRQALEAFESRTKSPARRANTWTVPGARVPPHAG